MEECVDILESHRISKEQMNGQRDEEELDVDSISVFSILKEQVHQSPDKG